MRQKEQAIYQPRTQQREIERLLKRFSVLVCHRRFGKTVLSVNRLIGGARDSELPDWRGAYVAPYYRQAKKVAWDYLKHFSRGLDVRYRESELRADFGNGARIQLYGANNPDSLRGMYLDGAVFDEVAQMPIRVWTEVVRPMLSDRRGWAMFIGTPQGKNALYDIWRTAKREPDWLAAMYRASETGIIDPDELGNAAQSMSPEEYEQEFECSFHASIRGAYYGALLADAERQGRITDVPWEPDLPVHTAWDLGMSDSTCIWFFQVSPGGQVRVVDYYENEGQGLQHYKRILDERGYAYGQHIAPHDIRVREMGTGKSRLETAAALGLRFEICPRMSVQDGINAVRNLLPKCWFDRSRCESGVEALRHYRREFSDLMGGFRDGPRHDWTSHAADGFRYFAVGFRPRDKRPLPARAVNDYDPFGGTK